mmetsp:Transcript_66146/g.176184  ORF Transcript_66146/g.176184 Transcript_66146/m.176184 type:complete len:587 (+) Transcript_66146:244-2004(+)
MVSASSLRPEDGAKACSLALDRRLQPCPALLALPRLLGAPVGRRGRSARGDEVLSLQQRILALVQANLPLVLLALLEERAQQAVLRGLEAAQLHTQALAELRLGQGGSGERRRLLEERGPAAERAGLGGLQGHLRLLQLPLFLVGLLRRVQPAVHLVGSEADRLVVLARVHARRRHEHGLPRPLVEEGAGVPLGRVHACGGHRQDLRGVGDVHQGLGVGVQHVLRGEGLPAHADVAHSSPHEGHSVGLWALEERHLVKVAIGRHVVGLAHVRGHGTQGRELHDLLGLHVLENDAVLLCLLLVHGLAPPLEQGLRVLAADAGLVLHLLQLEQLGLAIMRHIEVELGARGCVRVVGRAGVAVHSRLDDLPVEGVLGGDVLEDEAVGAHGQHHEEVVVAEVVGGVLEGLRALARSLQHEGLVALEMVEGALHAGAVAELAGAQDEFLVAPDLVCGAAQRRAVDGDGLHQEVLVALQGVVRLRHVLAPVLDSLEDELPVLAELARRPLEHRALARWKAGKEQVTVGQYLLRRVLELRPVAEDHGAPARVAEALQRDGGGARLLCLGRRQDAVPLPCLVDCIHQHGHAPEA